MVICEELTWTLKPSPPREGTARASCETLSNSQPHLTNAQKHRIVSEFEADAFTHCPSTRREYDRQSENPPVQPEAGPTAGSNPHLVVGH